MITVRPATESDAQGIFMLCIQMHGETDFKHFTFDPEKAFTGLHRWIDKEDAAMFVAVNGGEIIGMMAGNMLEMWFSHERCAAEQLLYVAPKSRGTRAAYLLAKSFFQWAHEKSNHIHAGVGTGLQNAAGKLYEKFGLAHVGGNFIKHC